MLVYLLKSTACLAVLYAFYNLFLEKESIHRLKRFYLLGALLFSLIVPALVFTEYVEAEPVNQLSYTEAQGVQQSEDIINVPPALEIDVLDISPILWGIYFIGVFFFGIKFLRNLLQIVFRIRKNPKHKLARITQVLLQEKITPHTFMSYIFLNKYKLESNQIPKEVLLHEETHAKQKHSLDVLFVELLQVIFWVNPLIYLSKKAIKLNHEFLADQSVLENNIDQTSYKNTLLSYLSPDSEKKYQPLSNAINYSSIKKRFTIMKKETSTKGIVLRSTLLLPLLTVLLLGFSETKTIIQKEHVTTSLNITDSVINPEIEKYNTLAKKYNVIPISERIIPLNDLKLLETIYRNMSPAQKEAAQPFPECLLRENQETATSAQLSQYNQLANKYNEMMGKDGNIRILKSDVDQLIYIYGIMSEKQKASAQPFPEFPEPPPPPKAPKVLKGEKSNIPPPPHAPKSPNTSDYADAEIERIIETQDPYDAHSLHISDIDVKTSGRTFYSTGKEINHAFIKPSKNYANDINDLKAKEKPTTASSLNFYAPPGSPQAPKTLNTSNFIDKQLVDIMDNQETESINENLNKNDIIMPPAPPTPPSPLDYVIDAAKKGATFMYEGDKISSDNAIELLKHNKELNIESRNKNGKQIVRITKDPVTID